MHQFNTSLRAGREARKESHLPFQSSENARFFRDSFQYELRPYKLSNLKATYVLCSQITCPFVNKTGAAQAKETVGQKLDFLFEQF